jgi:hypothetical protein
MSKRFLSRSSQAVLTGLLVFFASIQPSFAQEGKPGKILGGYFEEWSIYYAGYNIANLQQNGVADKLTHLIYAFANVTTSPAPACAIADTWADYSTPYLPRDSTTEGPSSEVEGAHVHRWRIRHQHRGICDCCKYRGRASSAGLFLH